MFYDKQSEQKRTNYKNMLQIIGSLSRIFSESDEPYLYYRVHENIFAKYFELENNARSDDSADAYSTTEKIGIGLKTWVGQDNQKVAEFGKLRPRYEHLKGIELIKRIAEYRNGRIQTTMNTHGIEKMLYHIVKRIPHAMCIYEATFDYIDIDNIILDEKRGNKNNIYFSDGRHTYHFSLSKNTLYMIFDNMEYLDTVDVKIYDDPYDLLSNLLKADNGHSETIEALPVIDFEDVPEIISESTPKKKQLCLRLYSTKKGKKFVANKSGLNQWNGTRTQYTTDSITGEHIKIGEKKRDVNELYIPYPAEDRIHGDFFPPRNMPFDLMLPNGEWISAKVCQGAHKKLSNKEYDLLSPEEKMIEDKRNQEGKAIMSNPNNVLGKWLLRDVFLLEVGTIVTYEMLEIFGIDSVIFTKIGEGKYTVDFCDIGTYEEFYSNE